jgi:predicted MarR family transcription regulator
MNQQPSDLKVELKNILLRHESRERAVTGRELAVMLRQRDDRQIRQLIRELIAEGLPVASSTGKESGYFIAVTREEVREYAESVKGRLINDALRRQDFKRAATLYLAPARQERLL